MRSDATSEARVRGEAPAAYAALRGRLSPNNCGEHARGKDGIGALSIPPESSLALVRLRLFLLPRDRIEKHEKLL